MLSQDIEKEHLKKQLEEVEKDIESIEKEINELQSFTRIKEFQLEKKKNLKHSLETRLNNLSNNDNSLSSHLKSEKVAERDNNFKQNSTTIKANEVQIDSYSARINDTKNIFIKADLMIRRKKIKAHNMLLESKNVMIESRQRMYIATSRLAIERQNRSENFKVSINNIKLRKMQEKYEAKITETHGLEEHKRELENNGNKITSRIMGKIINVYNKRDERVRSKFQKLLNTKSELIELKSARQFYASPEFTRNEQRVLEGNSLSYDDIQETVLYKGTDAEVVKDANGEMFVRKNSGEIIPVSSEKFQEYLANEVTVEPEEEIKGKVA